MRRPHILYSITFFCLSLLRGHKPKPSSFLSLCCCTTVQWDRNITDPVTSAVSIGNRKYLIRLWGFWGNLSFKPDPLSDQNPPSFLSLPEIRRCTVLFRLQPGRKSVACCAAEAAWQTNNDDCNNWRMSRHYKWCVTVILTTNTYM